MGRSNDYVALKRKWYKRLAEQGFKDIESEKGELIQADRRLISFQDREAVAQFFAGVSHYLMITPHLPARHRTILEYYADGMRINEIAARLELHRTTVFKIIQKHKSQILKLVLAKE